MKSIRNSVAYMALAASVLVWLAATTWLLTAPLEAETLRVDDHWVM